MLTSFMPCECGRELHFKIEPVSALMHYNKQGHRRLSLLSSLEAFQCARQQMQFRSSATLSNKFISCTIIYCY